MIIGEIGIYFKGKDWFSAFVNMLCLLYAYILHNLDVFYILGMDSNIFYTSLIQILHYKYW